MEFSRDELENLKFKTKGKWYSAVEVDEAIDKLSVSAQELLQENADLVKENSQLKKEKTEALSKAEKLEREISVLKNKAKQNAGSNTIEHQRKVCEELEAHRDELINDIKTLRLFRDNFKKVIQDDIDSMSEKLKELEADGIL